MSRQQNLRLVQGFYAAFKRGDIVTSLANSSATNLLSLGYEFWELKLFCVLHLW